MTGPGRGFRARIRGWVAAALALAALPAFRASALGPHEVLLLVNGESADSLVLGSAYARMRGIPQNNVVRVSVPCDKDGVPPYAITKEDFERLVWKPAREAVAERGLDGRILAWVYSCGFPARVADAPDTVGRQGPSDLSITGATIVGCQWPDADVVRAGAWVSPLFEGPAEQDGEPSGENASFDRARNVLLDRMPVPAAMLAWTGPRGLTQAEARAALKRSVAADRTAPVGTVWFAVRNDVRSETRAWQYGAAAEAVRAHAGFSAAVLSDEPSETNGPVVGYMTGARSVSPLPATLAPGAYADHFTSWAAAFDQGGQMKETAWLKGGAAFSSGTVTEPFAIWQKFPNAWLFPRMLDGATAMEAFYASVKCPLQQLPMGDPLSCPWAPEVKPAIEGADAAAPVSGAVTLRASLPDGARARFTWLVDGRPAGDGPTLFWNTRSWEDGRHTVRLAARLLDAPFRPQGFVETAFTVRNGVRAP